MDRRQLIEEIGLRLGGIEKADAALSAIIEIVVEQLAAGGKVALAGFGTFEPATRSGRMGRNPRTGEPLRVSPAHAPKFTAGRRFKEVVADPQLLLPEPTSTRRPQDTPSAQFTRDTFLLTNNPNKWELDADELANWVVATAGGHLVEGRWSTGATTKKISPGDRAFLLRQGVGKRGLFASGTVDSYVYQGEYWDGGGGLANYADVLWDTVVDPEDVLPIQTLLDELPEGQWQPQASGTQVDAALVERLEDLWLRHVAAVRAAPISNGAASGQGQGRRLDAKLRKEIEDLAQARLTKLYEDDGWKVEDLRYGNPFDAKATKGHDTIYLEAKGTVTDGERVIVTRGEVAWARSHPGLCIIGVLSGLTLRDDGSIDATSGTMRRYSWDADEYDLDPLDYDFYPPDSAALEES